MSLAKRNALVTGSTSGIGLAIARALAQEGANVVINGMGDRTAIENGRTAIEKDFSVKALQRRRYVQARRDRGDDRRRARQARLA